MAKEQQAGSWHGIPAIIDAIGRLFAAFWDKSPYLGMTAAALVLAFPFYCVHTWGSVKRHENAQSQRVSKAKKARDKRKQKGSGGNGK